MIEIMQMIIFTSGFFLGIRIIARYVFLEPRLKKKGMIIYCLMLIGSLAVYFLYGENIVLLIFIYVFFPGASLFMSRNEKKIRGFFLVFPIIGVIIGILYPLNYMIKNTICSIKSWSGYKVLVDLSIFFLLIMFYFLGRGWRIRFEKELQFRQIKKWEKAILSGTGLLVLILCLAIINLEETNTLFVAQMQFFVLIINFTVFILTILVTGFVWRGNKESYYEGLAKLNEQYLSLELEHFENYKSTQKEVRRMQHDMKNHFASLEHLCKKGSIKEVQEYLKSISELVEVGDMEINCGHSLADSICTHKGNIAANKGIDLKVKGRIHEQIPLMPVDLCTILSNALDNAIEAVEFLERSKRWIQLEMSFQGEMLFFRFSNPIEKEIDEIKPGKSSKEDSHKHGFGLLNIKHTIEKYNGQMEFNIEENKERIFVLSVIIGRSVLKNFKD